jgi:hypothetical protein
MPRLPKKGVYFFAGLLAIVLVYSLYYLYILDPQFFITSSRTTRRVLRFASLFVVYGIGLLAFRQWRPPHWLVRIWHIGYGAGVVILVLLGLYVGWIRPDDESFVDMSFAFHEFLISPVLYVIVGILDRVGTAR